MHINSFSESLNVLDQFEAFTSDTIRTPQESKAIFTPNTWPSTWLDIAKIWHGVQVRVTQGKINDSNLQNLKISQVKIHHSIVLGYHAYNHYLYILLI